MKKGIANIRDINFPLYISSVDLKNGSTYIFTNTKCMSRGDLVLINDIDIAKGKIKLRKKGGPGTHNGAKSVVHELVSEDFPRIRVGIGKPADEYDAIDYVIGKLDEEKYKALEAGINRAADATIYYIEHGIDNAMNKFN